MTNEEAIREIESYMPKDEPMNAKDREAFFMAIAALRAKPCGDAVNRADTLQSFESYCEKNCQYSKKQRNVMCRACMMGDAIEIVEDLPPVIPQPSWTHVSEDLPKESGEYLVSVIDEYDENYEAVGVARYDVEEGEWQDLGVDRTVIAWNHKPAPYKEGERANER